jgi:uncharacterized protein YfcZ (UPF0381/DUF406 family)
MVGGNGASTEGHESPCEDLHLLSGKVNRQASDIASNRQEIRATQEQVGTILQGVGEAAEHGKNASREVHAMRGEIARFRELMHDPINRLVEHYQRHYSDPPPLLGAIDYGPDAGEDTKTQSVAHIVSSKKHVERDLEQLKAEKDRVELAAKLEAERIAREAKAETDRVALEAQVKLERMKLIHTLIAAGVAIFTTAAGVVTTWLAMGGH